MAHSYSSNLYHVIFSTKERRRLIVPELQKRLWQYMGGIARDNRMKALAIGGIDDHVHLLLSLPATLAIAKAVQLVKGGSSKWVHDTFPQHRAFAWQEGYGAFSIGISQAPVTVSYIRQQARHHRRKTFQEEFLEVLAKHGIAALCYDPIGQGEVLSTGGRGFAVIGLKEQMLASHASQRDWLLKHHGIDHYLLAMRDWGAQRGRGCGVAFAEGFRQHLGHSYPQDNLLGRLLGTAG